MIDQYLLPLAASPKTWAIVWLFTIAAIVLQRVRTPDAAQRTPSKLWTFLGVNKVNADLRLGLSALWAVLFLAFVIGIALTLNETGKALLSGPDDTYRYYLLTLAAATASLSAIIALPFTLMRTKNLEAQTNATEQGLVTDRLNKAVEGLGAQKEVNRLGRNVSWRIGPGNFAQFEWQHSPIEVPSEAVEVEYKEWTNVGLTEPNLEVRIGSIYALERIAKENDAYHVQVMEILCAYIRENAPASEAMDWPELEMKESEDDGPLEADFDQRMTAFKQASNALKATVKPRIDIQTALTVIGRRSPEQRTLEAAAGSGKEGDPFPFDAPPSEYTGNNDAPLGTDWDRFKTALDDWTLVVRDYKGYRLDLRNTNLQGADMSRLNFAGARLEGARLQGADLGKARLQGAYLDEAKLQGAYLSAARLQGAYLFVAGLQGANLRAAKLQGAVLGAAKLQGAYLVEARLQGAYLRGAILQGANLFAARLQGAVLGAAKLQGAYLREAKLQGAHLGAAKLQGANLFEARLQGVRSLETAAFQGAALQYLKCTETPDLKEKISACFGDASVILPRSWDRPAHWPDYKMNPIEFDENWKLWRDDPEGYTPPAAPAPDEPPE